ncbi:OmpW family outer membrane protein [Microbulbifer sp. SAOS-129_SWC]|uniref:OmpW/AlkL family protein n=1 Tax=Microbulbifer sp. SAOS-129_SWC TaxID=3145235 RepID=UPI003217CC54
MKFKPLLIPLAVAGCAGLAAESAFAGPSGYPVQAAPPTNSFMIRIGAAYVEPDSKAYSGVQSFVVDDPSTGTEDNPVVENVPVDVGTRLDLDNDTTWYISFAWKPMQHFGLELYHYDNASHDATMYSSAATDTDFIGEFSQDLGSIDTDTTSILANWYPLGPNCLIQPYVGLGVAYLNVDEDWLRPVFGYDQGRRQGLIDFGSDLSWTAQIGVDFNFGIDSAWQINASAMYVDATPHLSLGYDTDTRPPGFGDSVILPVRIRDDMDVNPWMFNLGIGYKFSF